MAGGGAEDYNRLQGSGAMGGANMVLNNSRAGRMVLDPMDLFGGRAAETQAEIDEITRQTTQAQIDAQQYMYDTSMGLQQPFYEAGLGGLQNMQDMYNNPDAQINLNPMDMYQAKQGTTALNRAYAARGMGNSSVRQDANSDFLGNLSQDALNRQWSQNVGAVNVGQDSSSAMNNASQNMMGSLGNIHGNAASSYANSSLAMGQNAQNNWNTAGTAFGALGMYGAR